MTNERIHILNRLDLFAAFDDHELAPLAGRLEEVRLEAGATLFSEGSMGRDMFILTNGLLQISKDKRTITTIAPLNYIGEMAIIEEKPRSATVTALEDSILLRLTAAQFRRYIAERPGPLLAIMRTLSHRIRKNTEMIAAEFEKANILIHDMKNALTSFLLLDLIDGAALDETAARHVEIMRRSRNDLLEMVNEAMANAKRLRYRHPVGRHDLGALVRETAEAVARHPDIDSKEIELDIGEVEKFSFNAIDIRRLLTNLIINAGQASAPGGRVTVHLRREDSVAVLEVRDNGTGVAEEIQEAIFTPHFTTKESGNGLGLASCRDIVENRHGGSIVCGPNTPRGTVFTVRLPIRDG